MGSGREPDRRTLAFNLDPDHRPVLTRPRRRSAGLQAIGMPARILGRAWRHERHQIDLAHFANAKRWYEMLMTRPAVQRGFAVALS